MNRNLVIIALIAVLAGCQNDPAGEFFEPEERPRLVEQMLQTQAARGARADGNLFAAHFDGDLLSALGRDKLDLMVSDNGAPFPLMVYIAPGAPGDLARRQTAVRDYLLDAGLTAAQFRAVEGPNPVTIHPAAPQIANIAKTETAPAAPAAEEAPTNALADLLGGEKK